jgi:hypothetical protein
VVNYQSLLKTLDDMNEKTSPEDMKSYWMCFSIPREIAEKKKMIKKELDFLKESFYEDIQKDQ